METIKDKAIIRSILKRLCIERPEVKAWQNTHAGERIAAHATIYKFDFVRDEFICLRSRGDFEFEANQLIYCFFEPRSMVFKSHLAYGSDQKVCISLPMEIMYSEARKNNRQSYSEENFDIQYHFGNIIHGKLENFPFSSKLIDSSKSGIAFQTNLANISKFNVGDIVTLKLSHDNYRVIEGRVRHISPDFNFSTKAGQFKVGIGFV